MATPLYLRDETSDVTLDTATQRLGTTRGDAGVTVEDAATVPGPVAAPGIQIDTAAGALCWMSPPVAAAFTLSGTVTVNLWMSESSMNANVDPRVRVYRCDKDGVVLATVADGTDGLELPVTTRALVTWTLTPTSTAFAVGERIAVRVFGDDAGTMGLGFTFNLGYDGSTAAADGDSFVQLNENVTFAQAVRAGGITTAQAFGSTRARRILPPPGVASAEALGTPRLFEPVIRVIGGIASAEAFGASSVRRRLASFGNIVPLGASPDVVDTFNRADENPLSGWTRAGSASEDLRVLSNLCAPEASTECFAVYDAFSGADQDAQVDINALATSGDAGVLLRITTPGDITTNGYVVWCRAGDFWTIRRITNGTFTTLVNKFDGPKLATGDTLRATIVGDQIRGFIKKSGQSAWTLAVETTDSTHTAAGKAGLYLNGDSASRLDNFAVNALTNGFGRPTVTQTPSVRGVGQIASAEAFGTTSLRRRLAATGITTAEVFGAPSAQRRTNVAGNIEPLGGSPAVVDAFNRADENPIVGWTRTGTSTEDLRVVSNEVAPEVAQGTAVYNGFSTVDQDAQADLTTLPSSGEVGILLRITTPGVVSTDGYLVAATKGLPAGFAFYIARITDNGYTLIANQTVAEASAGDVLRATIVGSKIKGYIKRSGSTAWTLVVEATDSTYTAAGKAGLYFLDAATARMDNFAVGVPHFGVPTVTQSASTPSVSAVGAIASAEAFGTANLRRILAAVAISSAEAFGTAKLQGYARVTGVASAEAHGSQTARRVLAPVGIASAEAVGTPRFTRISVSGIASAEAFGTTAVRRSLATVGIATAEAHGTQTVRRSLAAAGISTAEAFGTTTVLRLLAALGISTAEAFGATAQRRILATASIGSAEAFGTARVVVAISVTGVGQIASAEAFGATSLRRRLASVGIASAEAFGTTTLRRLVATAGISTAEAFGTTALRRQLAATGIASAAAFGSTATRRVIATVGIASQEAFGTPRFTRVSAQGIASAEAFGTAKLRRILATVAIASAEAFGTARLTFVYTVSAVGQISSAEAFGTASLRRRLATVAIASAEAFGTTTARRLVSAAAIATAEAHGTTALRRQLSTAGIATAQAFGSTALRRLLYPLGIASAEAFGRPTVTLPPPAGQVTGTGQIASAEAFGTANLRRRVGAIGIASAEAFGPTAALRRLGTSGIATAQAFGTTILRRVVGVVGIASAESFGTPRFTRVSVSGIASAEAFGSASLRRRLAATGIASAEAHGTSSVARLLSGLGIASAEALGSSSLRRQITQIGIATAEACGTPAQRRLLAQAGIASLESFGIATLSAFIAPTQSKPGEIALADGTVAQLMLADGRAHTLSVDDNPVALIYVADAATAGLSVSDSLVDSLSTSDD